MAIASYKCLGWRDSYGVVFHSASGFTSVVGIIHEKSRKFLCVYAFIAMTSPIDARSFYRFENSDQLVFIKDDCWKRYFKIIIIIPEMTDIREKVSESV